MPEPKRRRMPKRSSRLAREKSTRPWTTGDVRNFLTNPVYGYGIVLEPIDRVPAAVQQFEQQLAEEEAKRGFGFTLPELDERFQLFFASLVETGSFTRGKILFQVFQKKPGYKHNKSPSGDSRAANRPSHCR